MKQVETEGVWWFPHSPEERLAGVLKYNDTKGGHLRLIGGSFVAQTTRKSYENYDYDLICGLSSNGKLVTLWQCNDDGTTFVDGRYYGQDISINIILWGCHFPSIDDIQFTKLEINYTFLEQWLNHQTFKSEWLYKESGERTGYSLQYNYPQIPENKFQGIKVGFSYRISSREQLNSSGITQFAYVEIESESSLHYDNFQKHLIYPLRNFLSLGIGRTIVPNSISGWSSIKMPDGIVSHCHTEIYASHAGYDVPIPNTLIPDKMLFTYKDMAEGLDNYLSKWFDLSTKIAPVMDLYFSLFFIRSMYLHSQFLTLAQALETYHRRLYEGTYIPADDYEEIKQILYAAIPDILDNDLKKKLKDVLKYANEFSLRKRIRAILEEVLKPYKTTVDLLVDNPKKFANDLHNLRNHLTHYSDKTRGGPSENSEMQYELIQKMKLIMQLQ